MVPIYLEGLEGLGEYGVKEFQERFLEICAEHRASGRALAFAFLLYDFRQPQVLKVLRDSDYWRALDRLSGRYLTVFSFQSAAPEEEYAVERRGMVGVTGAHDPGMKNQLILRSYFDFTGRLFLPAVLFFQVHGGEIVNYELWQLEEQKVEDAFLELREALGVAVGAVEKVLEENRDNSHEIFNLIKQRLAERRLKLRITKGVKVMVKAKEAASLGSMLIA